MIMVMRIFNCENIFWGNCTGQYYGEVESLVVIHETKKCTLGSLLFELLCKM